MKLVDLDGKTFDLNLRGFHVQLEGKSELHLKARELLKQRYPFDQVLEEVTVPLNKTDLVYLDFFIPRDYVCVEVQGGQHYKFTEFFHKNKQGWIQAQKRDRNKRKWLEMNKIKLIELPYNKIPEWPELLGIDSKD